MTYLRTIARNLRNAFRSLRARQASPRRRAELAGKRVVFEQLVGGDLAGARGGRILEIGPKHGQDSLLLATLEPRELVLIDLPEKQPTVRDWLPKVSAKCNTKFIEGNVLYLSPEQYRELGAFDLVWCLGVLYHNAEQLRLLRKLFELCCTDGTVVIESATTRDTQLVDKNVVEIFWPVGYRGQQTITHLPSRLAIKSWLEMAGFCDVRVLDVYSSELSWQRAVLLGKRPTHPRPYVSYAASGMNPTYVVGEAQ